MKKFLTGITITFNSQEVIKKLLFSVEKVINDEIDWIFVDSGSKDDTPKILRSFKRCKVFCFKKNIGFSKSNNFAFKNSDSEYIFFCNPDISFDKEKFFSIVDYLKKENPPVLVPMLKNLKGEKAYFIRSLPNFLNILTLRWHRGKISKNEKIQPAFSAIFIKSHIFEELNGFDENFFVYFTDVEFFERFYRKGYKDIYFSEIDFQHSEGSVLSLKKYEFLKKYDFSVGFLKYFFKYGGFLEKIFALHLFIFNLLRSLYYYLF